MKAGAVPDVAIVGSGIAGTTIAYLLTKWGRRVTMFEAGPGYEYPHSKQYGDEILHQYRDPKYVLPPDLRRLEVTGNYGANGSLLYEQIMNVGGMATRWSAWTPRYPATDFKLHSLFGYGQDWPLTYDELEPYYCEAEALIGVSGTDEGNPHAPRRSKPYPLPAFPFTSSDRILGERLRAHGIAVHAPAQARTSGAYDGRPGCANFGVCGVCPIGVRYSPNHHLERALATGLLSLETEAAVRRVFVERPGQVAGLQYYQQNRRPMEQGARAVVVAAGAIESARLFLLSARQGGAAERLNQSGQVGQNLMFNHIWGVKGRYREPLYVGRAGASTAQSHQFVDPPGRRKHGGVKIDFVSQVPGTFPYDNLGRGGNAWQTGPAPVALHWRSADQVMNEVGRVIPMQGFGIHAETVPSPQKYVALSAIPDRFGDPFAKVHHESSAFDEEARIFASQIGEDLFAKTGGFDVKHDPHFKSGHHHLGTCRMGTDPQDSVVDPHGRVHGFTNLYVAGGSVFPASSSMNPTLTIVALAIRMAGQIHASLPK